MVRKQSVTDRHRQQRRKNIAVLVALIALVVLIYVIAIVRMGGG